MAATSALDRCLSALDLPRVARVRAPDGAVRFARVLDAVDGIPVRVAPIGAGDGDLAGILERADAPPGPGAETWPIGTGTGYAQICSPVPLSQAEIDAETRVVVAAGLNYAAHAEEAGGGDVFLFPKPVAPTPPYGVVSAPAGVVLLDYEVELGLVLLADVDLADPPPAEELLGISAFFVANEVTDREPIIRHKALIGPGTGFVEGKGQPGFLPAGPWLVRGTELGAALFACGADGIGLRLAVDEGEGFELRQEASTELMLQEPHELIGLIAQTVARDGLRTPMPVLRGDTTRHYPLAVDPETPRLPAGSVLLTGTPAGVALATPNAIALIARGLGKLRGPFEQFRQEELARAAADGSGGYLEPGDRVRAEIDGLGAQVVRIAEPGGPHPDPCSGH